MKEKSGVIRKVHYNCNPKSIGGNYPSNWISYQNEIQPTKHTRLDIWRFPGNPPVQQKAHLVHATIVCPRPLALAWEISWVKTFRKK